MIVILIVVMIVVARLMIEDGNDEDNLNDAVDHDHGEDICVDNDDD